MMTIVTKIMILGYDHNNDNKIQVGRWEAGDEEWRSEIQRGLQGSGLVPGLKLLSGR